MRLLPRSVRGKAVLGAGVAVSVVGLMLGVASLLLVEQAATNATAEVLSTRVGEVRQQLADRDTTGPEAIEIGSVKADSPAFVQVVSAEGRILATTPGANPEVRLCPTPLPTVPMSDTAQMSINGARATFLRQVDVVSTPSGQIVVCAVASTDSIARPIRAVVVVLTVGLPLVVIALCLAVWYAVGRALHAVDDLRSQAEEMQSTTDAELRVKPTGDEVERLGRTFNELLRRLHHQTQATRRFIADAGHELRNPLTTVRVSLEFGEDASESELRASVYDARADLDRLENLVQDLLMLARTDAMEIPATRVEVDLSELVSDAVAAARKTNPDLEFSETLVSCESVVDAGGIRSIVSNLLDNAARHARTLVAVAISSDQDGFTITVDDDGAGLAAQDCERVFDRFVRLDEARVRDAGGSGLGLAIVAAVAGAHGGKADARPRPGGHFSVWIPHSRAQATSSRKSV